MKSSLILSSVKGRPSLRTREGIFDIRGEKVLREERERKEPTSLTAGALGGGVGGGSFFYETICTLCHGSNVLGGWL